MVRIDLKVERRPPAFGRAGDHAREQRRAHSSAAPGWRNVKFIQPSAPAAVFQTENARRVGDANRLVVGHRRKDKTLLWLDEERFQSCDKLVGWASEIVLRELYFKQRRDRSQLLDFELLDGEFSHRIVVISLSETREVDPRSRTMRRIIRSLRNSSNSEKPDQTAPRGDAVRAILEAGFR